MEKELKGIEEANTWDLTKLPPGRKAIQTKWVLTRKNLNNEIVYKARLVAKGYSQVSGTDFTETYAPTAKATTIRVVLALATMLNLDLKQFDFNSAFLNGVLKEDI